MENPIRKKINLFGKVGKIISMIIIICLLVAEGFMLVGTIVLAALPEDAVSVDIRNNTDFKVSSKYMDVEDEQIMLKLGGSEVAVGKLDNENVVKNDDGTVSIQANTPDAHFETRDAIKIMIPAMISLAAVVTALYFLRALMKAFQNCETPFADEVIRKMRNFSIALIPTMAVSMFCDGMMKMMMGGASAPFSVNFANVGFVVIIFILTAVFRYGAQLQKQADETV